MSDFEIVPASPNGSLSLREMAPGSSWVSPAYIGVTADDQAALMSGTMTTARQIEIYEAGQRANDALVNMPVPGVQDWMTLQRILS